MIPIWIEEKYISLLRSRLRNFTRSSNHNYNFSCPICGDSKTKKSKARGYIYLKDGRYIFYCHNCNDSRTFSKLLQFVDPELYNNYTIERFQQNGNHVPYKSVTKAESFSVPKNILSSLNKVSQLNHNHICKNM